MENSNLSNNDATQDRLSVNIFVLGPRVMRHASLGCIKTQNTLSIKNTIEVIIVEFKDALILKTYKYYII